MTKNIPAPPDPPAAAYAPSAAYDYDPYPSSDASERSTRREILFVLAVAILASLLVFGLAGLLYSSLTAKAADPCWLNTKNFACLDRRVQECVASEKYTKEQCVILVGGNK